VCRTTKKDAQEWFDNIPFNSVDRDRYHLLECPDDPAMTVGRPKIEDLQKLSLANYSTPEKGCWIQIKNDDGTYSRLTQLQEAFELAFKLEQPLPDSRDVDGNSWRDRPKLF